MTYILNTKSHGDIESGFFASFTQFVRLGEHTFATKHLCDLVKFLADNPQVKETKILCYNLDKFWERFGDHISEIVQLVAETEESWLPELQYFEMNRQLEQSQGKISLEDEVDMHDEARMIPVKVASDESSVTIGEYKICSLYFGRWAQYVAEGGFFGWMKSNVPDFSEPTLQSMKNSKNPLYEKIQKELF